MALIRKHKKVTPNQVTSFADLKKHTSYTDQAGESWRKFRFQPGMVLDASNVDYEFIAPSLQARDVSEDGRNIRLSFSAMTGLPEFMTSGDASNSNYASTMVAEGPGIREFEDWIDFFTDVISYDIWPTVMEQAGLKSWSVPRITVPALIARDRKKEAEVNEILFQNGVISLAEWRRREGLEDEKMQREIDSVL